MLPRTEELNINVADRVHAINRARSRPQEAQETPVHADVVRFVLSTELMALSFIRHTVGTTNSSEMSVIYITHSLIPSD